MLNRGYRKAGSYMKTIATTLGPFTFKVIRFTGNEPISKHSTVS